MSHFLVLVALPADVPKGDLEHAVGRAMAPYDEGLAVEPYRVYEDGAPEEFWFVQSVRRGAEHHRNGTGLKEYDPGLNGSSSTHTNITPEQQRAVFAEDSVWAEKLGSHPTWVRVVEVHNECYPDGVPVRYDAEQDRVYAMTTYNQQSKWDYWLIGGRWQGRFLARDEHREDLILTDPAWGSSEHPYFGRCDGGRKRALDLVALRAARADEAAADWDDYAATVDGTPLALPWTVFAERVDRSGNGGYSIDDARRDYRAQDRIRKLCESDRFRRWDDAHDTFESLSRDEYRQRQADRAVPGYAMLDGIGDRGWMAPGEMGPFGMGTDDQESFASYVETVNRFVDELPVDAWLIALDCHS